MSWSSWHRHWGSVYFDATPGWFQSNACIAHGRCRFYRLPCGARASGAGHGVTIVDEINTFYDPVLKRATLSQFGTRPRFRFVEVDIAEAGALNSASNGQRYDIILHLAAQAGVRYAVTNPSAYTRSNLIGHASVFEFARHHAGLKHLDYASSSSVYGNDTAPPFCEDSRPDGPVSFYGATKRAGELLSHSYSEFYGLPQTGLRFLTVYGPGGAGQTWPLDVH